MTHEDLVAPAGLGRELGVEGDDAVDARGRHARQPGDLVDHRLGQVAVVGLHALQHGDEVAVRVDLVDHPTDLGQVERGDGRAGCVA